MATKSGGRIEPGDQGIWATCVKGKEGKATEELRDLLEEVSYCPWAPDLFRLR